MNLFHNELLNPMALAAAPGRPHSYHEPAFGRRYGRRVDTPSPQLQLRECAPIRSITATAATSATTRAFEQAA